MTTIIPAGPATTPEQMQKAAFQALAVVAGKDIPEKIVGLPQGALFDAVIKASTVRQLFQAITADGTLSLKSPAAGQLPDGAKVVLQLVQNEGQYAFRIVSVNGRPFLPGGMPLVPMGIGSGLSAGAALLGAIPGAQTGAAQTAGTAQAGAPGAANPGAPLPPGLIATMVRPAGAAGAPMAGGPAVPGQMSGAGGLPPDLPPGTQIAVRIASVTAAPQPGAASPQIPGPAPAGPSAAGGTPAPVSQPGAQATAGTGAPAGMTGQPAPAPLPPAAGAPAGGAAPMLLAGNVVSHPPGGAALIQTPAGTISLPSPAQLPEGARIMLEVAGKPTPPPPPSVVSAAGPGPGASGWTALAEAVDVLARTDQQAAESLMRAIPQANVRLAASLSAFAGALRSGEARVLAGDGVTKGLEKAGRRDLADRLKGDFEKLSADAARPVGNGEWRALSMPFMHGAEIDPITLFLRKPEDEIDEDGKRKGGGEHRFILEINMSRLGRIQFDGLIQREAKRFDLILRTDRPLPEDMRRDIAGIFSSASELVGTKGYVSFQSGGRFVELPPAEPGPGTRITV